MISMIITLYFMFKVNTINEDDSLETKIPQHIQQSIASITDDTPDNIQSNLLIIGILSYFNHHYFFSF